MLTRLATGIAAERREAAGEEAGPPSSLVPSSSHAVSAAAVDSDSDSYDDCGRRLEGGES